MLTLSPAHSHEQISGNFARKKFCNRNENASSSFSNSVEKSREESPGPASATKAEVSPRPESEASSYQSHETEHIAKKKTAIFSGKVSSRCSTSIHNSDAAVISSVSSLPDKLGSIKSLFSSGKSKTETVASGSGSLPEPNVVRSAPEVEKNTNNLKHNAPRRKKIKVNSESCHEKIIDKEKDSKDESGKDTETETKNLDGRLKRKAKAMAFNSIMKINDEDF